MAVPLVVPLGLNVFNPPAHTLYTSATAQSVCLARAPSIDTKKPKPSAISALTSTRTAGAVDKPGAAAGAGAVDTKLGAAAASVGAIDTKPAASAGAVGTKPAASAGAVGTKPAASAGAVGTKPAGSAGAVKLPRSPSADMQDILSPRSVAHDEAVEIADQFLPTLNRLCEQVATLETALDAERAERKAEIADLRQEHAAALGDQLFASALADMLPFLQKTLFHSTVNKTLNDLLLHASGKEEKAKAQALAGLKACPLSDVMDPLLLAFKAKGQRNEDRHYLLDGASTNIKVSRIAYMAWALQTGDPTGTMEADADSVSAEWSSRPDLCEALGNRLKHVVTTGEFASFASAVDAFFKYLDSKANTFGGHHMFDPKFVNRHCQQFVPPNAEPLIAAAAAPQRPVSELTLAEVKQRMLSESDKNTLRLLAERYKLLRKQQPAA